ncbi:hypothetical protein [Paracoccus sp. TOH]|uniref:hypothetical protein n=1 Tax=Paracoccus sp. TOH TaxID=1263728 RepID=UPI0025B0AA89|nr:hypothetical protein [Paracoccus sp. TOH]WJS83612.1 hypothetical protein NBE95_07455 [Paracoccus sp. TOH]
MERVECNRNCWISAAIAGVLVLLSASGIGDLHWLAGLFLGAVTFALFGALMVWLICEGQPEPLPPFVPVMPEDLQRRQLDSQPEALLVSALLPEQPTAAQMPMDKAMPAGAAAATADDLRRIKGIGPKISDWLQEHGVTRYAQIAAWDRDAAAGFAQRMGRMGSRIEADDWVGQARLLAAGGETAHSRRVDTGEAG